MSFMGEKQRKKNSLSNAEQVKEAKIWLEYLKKKFLIEISTSFNELIGKSKNLFSLN